MPYANFQCARGGGGEREMERVSPSRLKISTILITPIICVNDGANYRKLLHKSIGALISLDIILVKFISALEMIPLVIIYLNV